MVKELLYTVKSSVLSTNPDYSTMGISVVRHTHLTQARTTSNQLAGVKLGQAGSKQDLAIVFLVWI